MLTKIELPLAVPVIIAGVRTAMIINIGMATLAFLIGGGGLGITINSGLKLHQHPVLIVGGSAGRARGADLRLARRDGRAATSTARALSRDLHDTTTPPGR